MLSPRCPATARHRGQAAGSNIAYRDVFVPIRAELSETMESGAFERTQTPQPKWLLDPKQSHGLIPGYVLATGAPCCMDRRCGRTEPDPCSGLCDADVLRASEVQHTVQHVGGDRHFARLTPVRLEA